MSLESETSRTPDDSGSMHLLQWAASLLGVACVVGFIIGYPPANELAWEAGKILFSLLSTPFLMEGFCVIFGFILVIFLNNRRLAKENADEWVYLKQADSEGREIEDNGASSQSETD